MDYCIAIGMSVSPGVPLPIGGNLTESLEYAASLGYGAVELHTPFPRELDVVKIRTVCKKAGLRVATIGTGTVYGNFGLSLTDESVQRQKLLLSMINDYIEAAAALNSKVTIGSIKGNSCEKEKGFARMADMMQRINEDALKSNVTLLLEATNRYENNLLNTVGQVRKFIDDFQLKQVEILADSFHINLEETTVHQWIKDAGPYLGHIHFADNNRYYPGAGCFDFEKFNSAIRKSGYDGYLSIECLPLPDPNTAAEYSIRFLKRNFALS